MNVVLLVPPFNASPEANAAKIKHGRLRPLPPLGLGYLAAGLEAAGHAVRMVDAQARQLDLADTVKAALADNPGLVGISCFTTFAKVCYALANAIRAERPSLPLALGGPHATAFHERILDDCRSIDYVVPGEAERVFPELVTRIEASAPLEDLHGIIYRAPDGSAVATPPAEPLRRLDELIPPARHVYAGHEYVPLPNQTRRRPVTTMLTSRGCPWAKCRFCYQGGKYAVPYRRRSPENVIDEIKDVIDKYGIREILFWDDNFCVNENWINRFCDLLDAEKINLTWTVQGRVNTITPTMLHRMVASGCYNLFLGFESGNQQILDLIDKGITLEQIRQAVGWANEAGLEVRGSFMLGLPSETPEMGEQTIRFACELGVDYMIFMPYHIQTGTVLEETALREGRVFESGDTDWNVPSYVPCGYSGPEELAAMLRKAYRRFYLRPAYIARALRRAKNPIVAHNYFLAFFHWLDLTRAKQRSTKRIASP